MALSEIDELRADIILLSGLATQFGLVAMTLVAEIHGRERALQMLDNIEQGSLLGLVDSLDPNSPIAQEAGRRIDKKKAAVFAAIAKQLEVSPSNTRG